MKLPSYGILASEHVIDGEPTVFPLEYEELVELLAAIRDTPKRGNELFDSAKAKAAAIMLKTPVTDY